MRKKTNRFSSMQYKKGGEKQEWISNKIATLLEEDPNMPQKQAISIALNLSNEQFQDGGTPKKPLFGAESMFPISRVDKNVNGDYIVNYTNNQIEPATYSKEDFEAKLKLTQPSADAPGQYDPYLLKYMGKTQGRTGQTVTYQNGGDYSFNSTPNFGSIEKPKVQGFGYDPNFQSRISPTSITAGEDFKKDNPLPEGTFQADPFGVSSNRELDTTKKTENFQPMQFFNPYAGVDLAQGANALGQSIENGDALGIVAGGAKVLAGTARNIFGGMGQARIKNEGMKNYYDAQRDNMIGKSQQGQNGGAFPNFQDGGNYKTTSQGLESKINETLGTTGEGKGGNSGLMGEIKLINKRNDGYGILYDTDEGDKYEVVKSNAFTGMQDLPELKRYKYKRGEYSDPNFLEDGRNVEALKRGWQSSGYNPSTTTYPESVEAYRAAIGKPSFYPQEQMTMAKQKSPQMVGSFQDGGAIYPMEEPTPYESFPNGVYEAPAQQFPTGIYQAPEVEATPTPSFDTNSARDTWVQKTGLPWSEAKKLGYTDGSAKDNKKLLSELNDPRFKKEYLRTEPIQKVTKTEAKKIIPKAEATPQLKKSSKESELQRKMDSNAKSYKSDVATKKEDKDFGDYIEQGVEYVGNPGQALSHLMKYGDLPAKGFSKNGRTDGFDDILGRINPAKWFNAGFNALDAVENEDYGRAGKEVLNAAGALSKLKYVKYVPLNKALPAARTPAAQAIGQGAKRLNVPSRPRLYQDGGEQQDPLQMVSEALQQGATEEQIAQILMQQGYSEEEIGQIFEQLQGQQSFQEGGEQQGQAEQIYQMVAEALQSGADPQEIAQQLISSGIPKEEVMQIIQEVMSQMQQTAPAQEQPQMKNGGSFDQLIGKKILGYEYNKDKDTYSVRYE